MQCNVKLLNCLAVSLFLSSLLFPASINAQQKLAFAVNAPGAAPYLYLDQGTQTYQGLVVDFFASIADLEEIEVEYLQVNRARSEQFIYAGKADLFLSSLAWVKYPEKVLSTQPLIQNRAFLYATKPFAVDFTLANLSTEHICTRLSYVYPTLEAHFQARVRRVDSSSQATMLSMMLNNRCDYAIINEYNAMSLMHAEPFCNDTFYRSPQPVSSVPNAFLLGKSQHTLVAKINAHLEIFKASDKYQASLNRHTLALSSRCQNSLFED